MHWRAKESTFNDEFLYLFEVEEIEYCRYISFESQDYEDDLCIHPGIEWILRENKKEE